MDTSDSISLLPGPAVGQDVKELLDLLMKLCDESIPADCFEGDCPSSGIDPHVWQAFYGRRV